MVGLGGDCTAGSELCGPGYTCASGSCVSFPQVGDACSPGTTPICIGGYCATSTCVAFKGLGASCTFDFECASFNCNAVTNVCTLGYCVMP
jgi:hypothetical protein